LDYQAGQREGVALRPFSVSQRPATPVAQGFLSFFAATERSETFFANSKKVGNLTRKGRCFKASSGVDNEEVY